MLRAIAEHERFAGCGLKPSQRRTNFILLSQGSQVLLANLFADPALFADIPTEAAGQLIEIMRNKLFVPRVHPDRIEAAN